jgi:hypothetical protein
MRMLAFNGNAAFKAAGLSWGAGRGATEPSSAAGSPLCCVAAYRDSAVDEMDVLAFACSLGSLRTLAKGHHLVLFW